MNTSLMRFSAKRALEEGSISREEYSRILAQADRIDGQKMKIDEQDLGKVRKNMLQQLAR